MNMSTNQGPKAWYQCYHSTTYPVITFVHTDHDELDQDEENFHEMPQAVSTFIDHSQSNSMPNSRLSIPNNSSSHAMHRQQDQVDEYTSYSVGHISHIPRIPPSQTTFAIPSMFKNQVKRKVNEEEDIFGLIKLKENDVCYTSGTIEWVGRKRSFPINSGFKILNDDRQEPTLKKTKVDNVNNSNNISCSLHHVKECDCADILPTVNAIVDHLNAIHEAVDIVDLRLNTLEDAVN